MGVVLQGRTLENKNGGDDVATSGKKLESEIRSLSDLEKLRLVDAILADLDKPDPELDRIWAEEARRRLAAYKAGRIPSVSYEDVMGKHRRV
ncbi:MAG: addiction module protein [Candidatus Aminicenantes bacterium]|nr:addiction module protein [Candidatus Aminicenantes bacterium]